VIHDIKSAGVKLWVLTGDKVETAINIGFSCELLDQEMEIFVIDKISTKEVYKQVVEFTGKKKIIGASRDCAVVIGGESLAKVLNDFSKDHRLKNEFMNLVDDASVVLACRVSPKQKAEIVILVRENKTEVTTLAIGDGANDVNMITAAHIGIGISGLEGQQAARAADYSIGQFRFLKNLLFVHGREAYRRNSYLIMYMFYKNVIYVMPIFFFGIESLFSGTQIYDVYLYNAYNIFFTGAPITWYSIFDWQHTKEELLSNVKHYSIGLENKCFNPFLFWTWYIMAIWQGAVLLFLTFNTLDESSGEQYVNNTFLKDIPGGKTISGSLILNGLFIFQAIVILVNVKIFIQTNTHSFMSVFC